MAEAEAQIVDASQIQQETVMKSVIDSFY